MSIPDEKIDEVRTAADLVEVAEDYVQLKQSGSRYMGLCPFHNEDTPSFSVDPDQNLYYCFGCLDEDERIWTQDGLTRMGAVEVGDTVLGINGRTERVTQIVRKRGSLLNIAFDAARTPLRLTPDHTCVYVKKEDALHAVPMLYRQRSRGVRFQSRKQSYQAVRTCPRVEADAQEVDVGDYFLFPVIPAFERSVAALAAPGVMPVDGKDPAPTTFEELPVTPQTARLYGLWIAEGSTYRGGIRWSFSMAEESLAQFAVEVLQQVFELPATVHRRPEKSITEVTCSNTHLSYLLPYWFGRGAAGKEIPFQALRWPPDLQRALLRGYVEGDGSEGARGAWTAQTISGKLAHGIFALAIQAQQPVTVTQLSENTCAGNPVWNIVRRNGGSRHSFFHDLDGRTYYWMQVSEVTRQEGKHSVVDISTTGSHTFTTRAGAVHNCQRGGDVFKFVQEIEGVGFLEGVRILAERYSIPLPEEEADQEAANERESILHALRFAARFFYRQLTQSDRGRVALDYLRGRGFSPSTIKQFGLGYAPNEWDALLSAAEEEQLDPETLEKAGLVIERNDGSGYYDRYRGRIIFPIFSHIGKVLAFAGRILDPDDERDQPKYINSPETEVYHKKEVVYGLHQAKRAVRQTDEVLLVEGYTDVISLSQAGIENVVASSGTALTEQQVGVLDRYANRAVMLYDADEAGARAAMRGLERVLAEGMGAYAVELPAGSDPDDYVQEQGGDAFADYVAEHRQDLPSFAYQRARENGELETPEGRVEVQREIIDSVARIPDPNLRREYVARTSEVTSVPDSDLFRMLDEAREQIERREQRRQDRERRRQARPEPAEAQAAEAPTPSGGGNAPPPSSSEPEASSSPDSSAAPLPEERVLLRLMLEHGRRMIAFVLGHMAFDEFTEGPPRELARTLAEMHDEGTVEAEAILGGKHGDALQQLGASVLMNEHEASKHWAAKEDIPVPSLNDRPYEAAESAMKLLKLDRVNEAIEAIRERMYQATQQDDDDRVQHLQQKMMSLQELRKSVKRGDFLDD
jgi:DNA primase